MGNILQRIAGRLGLGPGPCPPHLDQAIDLILDNSYPKIRLIRGHKQQLRDPVEAALKVITDIIDAIPGPVDLTAEKSIYDRFIRPFFIDQPNLQKTLGADPDLNEFRNRHALDDFFVLLTMNRTVKTVFGSRLQDGIVLRDEPLKAVGFSDYRFRVPSATLEGLKRALANGVLQILAHGSLETVLEEQSRKEQLSQLKAEVKIKIQMMAAERQAMVLEWKPDSGTPSYQEAQHVLEQIETELNAINTRSLAPDYYLSELSRCLRDANRFFATDPAVMHFDRMGILLDGSGDEQNEPVRTLDVKLGDALRRSCILLKCSPQTLFEVHAG